MNTSQAGTSQDHAFTKDDSAASHKDLRYTLRTKNGEWQLVVDLPSMEAAADAIKNISKENNNVRINVAIYDQKAKCYVTRPQIVLGKNNIQEHNSEDVKVDLKNDHNIFSALTSVMRITKIAATSIFLIFISYIVFLVIYNVEGRPDNQRTNIVQPAQNPALTTSLTSDPSSKLNLQLAKKSATILIGVDALIQRIPEICDINFDVVNMHKLDLASSTMKLDVKSASGRTIDTGDASTGFVNSGSSSAFSKMFTARCADITSISARSTSNRYNDDNASFGYSTVDNLQVEQLSSSKIPILVSR